MPMTQREWIKLLESHGWSRETGGKHQVEMTKAGERPITLPANRRTGEPANRRQAYSKGMEAAWGGRRGFIARAVDALTTIESSMDGELNINVHLEDGAFWATVDQYPGVFATGDTMDELTASLAEGIALVLREPDGPTPTVELVDLRASPIIAGSATAAPVRT